MNALILQHESSTPPGSTLEWLKSRQISFQILEPAKVTTYPDLKDFDLLIICGGSMNVDEEAKFPWLKFEKDFIHSALKNQKMLVGLCLGGQLLSEALGGEVKKQPQYEVGWHQVNLKNGEKLMAFQWHGYGFTLPAGAELEAENSNCKYQAFSYRHHVLGFQFHPETTLEWAIECSNSKKLPQTGFVQTSDEIKRDNHFQPQLQAWYFNRLDQLLETYRKSPN